MKINIKNSTLETLEFLFFEGDLNILARKWGDYPSRLWNNFVSLSSVFTVVSFLVAIAGAKLESDFAQIIGWLVFGAIVIYNFFSAIPEEKLVLKKLVGKKLSLNDLSQIHPKPYTLGVIGLSKSGKSTFMHKSLHSTQNVSRTNEIYCEIIPVPRKPDNYFVVVDGDGDKIYQQIEIMNAVDCLLIFVDHSESHQRKQLSQDRLDKHEEFFKDLSDCLNAYPKKHNIHVVLNKKDLWESSQKKDDLTNWFNGKTDEMASKLNLNITKSFHSNMQFDSVSQLLNKISSEVLQRND
ncbi:GTPase domain-containing protein [Acinetobacter towneri]|uniref:GTPase domain-containing protein n=1 Tax=Acinetobacter towneri TaxID=202956 RepID=UPI003A8A7715